MHHVLAAVAIALMAAAIGLGYADAPSYPHSNAREDWRCNAHYPCP
jgi:hypothetical protein